MNEQNAVTKRQYNALLFTALLSPFMRTLPRAAVGWAGKAAWLCPLLALPLILGLLWLTSSLRRGMGPGEGLSALILRVLGPIGGRVLLLLFAGGILFYAGFVLRCGAERFASTVYQQSRPEPFMLLLLAPCFLAARGTGRALARTAVVLGGILLPVLAAVFLLTLPNLSIKNLLPLTVQAVPDAILGAFPIFPAACVGAFVLFCGDMIPPEMSVGKRTGPALLLLTAVGCFLCLETVGVFGYKLTGRLSYPFFTMTRDVSLFHLAQRVEAMVIALWVFADFTLCALLLRSAHEILRAMLRLSRPGRGILWAEAGAVYLCAHFLAPSAAQTLLWQDRLVPLGVTALVPGGFLLVLLVGKLRRII